MKIPKQFDIEFGRHSNIPECCINYYINIWVPAYEIYGTNSKERKEYDFKHRNIPRANYIRCPECIKNKVYNELHHCNKKCVDYKLELFNRLNLSQYGYGEKWIGKKLCLKK